MKAKAKIIPYMVALLLLAVSFAGCRQLVAENKLKPEVPVNPEKPVEPEASKPFITKWQIPVDTKTITLPLREKNTNESLDAEIVYSYDLTVDWGDGTTSEITSWNDPDTSHTYRGTETTALVSITVNSGHLGGWGSASTVPELVDIVQWGDAVFTDTQYFLCRFPNVVTTSATDAPVFTGVMTSTFYENTTFQGDISNWNVQDVTSMWGLFSRSSFNGDISGWNVSNVTNMYGMFSGASFDGDLSNWNVSKVTTMQLLFSSSAFTGSAGSIGSWQVQHVTNMTGMFTDSEFNGDLSAWELDSIESMHSMFVLAKKFRQDMSGWTNWAFKEGVDYGFTPDGKVTIYAHSGVTKLPPGFSWE